jgi:tetratricopeptide (TPR) repeat protein
MRRSCCLLIALGLLGCSSKVKSDGGPAASSSSVAQAVSAAPGRHGALPFIEDDADRALAEARRRNVPVFVDAWAPWCHTCLSFRAFVLEDPAMAPLADRFVWLAIDTEKEKNQAFLRSFPVEFWPTLGVLDPATGKAIVKWPGSLTLAELTELLTDAEQAVKAGDSGGEAIRALLRGEQEAAAGHQEASIEAFQASIKAAPPSWSRRARAVDGLTTQLTKAEKYAECAHVAHEQLPTLGRGTSVANVALAGLECSAKLPAGKETEPVKKALFQAVEDLARDSSQPILADDRSSLFEALVDARKQSGDKEGARRLAIDWSAFVDARAAAAKSPAERVVFDAHRMLAYLELGEASKALTMIEQSQRDFPGDYNHPARLAKVYSETSRFPEALAAIDRSLSLAYGPRKLKLFSLKARILTKQGDRPAARAVLEEGIREGEAMKLEGKQAKGLADLRAELAR